MNHKKTLLSAAIMASLCLAAQAGAQEAAQQPTNAQDLDTIVVTGIRGSIERALDVKRDAQSHVEVVTAEDIGKLPAKNVADTLRELPGVNIGSASADEGAFDEADRVSLRGTNPSLTQTLINGHTIGSGDWFVMSQYATVGRSVSYSLFPSEIVSQVVVNKSSEAKLVEGGSAGSVNIITRKPLEFDKPITAAGSVGAVYADLPGKTDPQLDLLVNFRNEAGTLGLLVQGFSEERHLRRDGQENLSWFQIADDSAAALANPDLAGVWAPGLVGSALFEQKRSRSGGSFSLQAKPLDNLDVSLNGFYSKLKASNFNRNYMLWGSNFIPALSPDAYTVKNGVLTSASYSGAYGTYGVYDQIYRPGSAASSGYISLDADWAVSDNLDVKLQAGTTKGHGKTEFEIGFETNTAADGASFSIDGPGSPTNWNLINPSTNGFGWAWGNRNIDVVDKEDWFAADATWYGDGVLKSIDFGARYSDHTRENDSWTNAGPGCSDGTTPAQSGLDWGQPSPYCAPGYSSLYDESLWPNVAANYPGDYANGIGGNFPTNVWYYAPGDLQNLGWLYLYADPVVRNMFENVYAVKEKTAAAYVQFNLEGERWSGNVGLRYVKTDSDIHFNQALPAGALPDGAVTSSAFGPYLPRVEQNDYNKLLPSLNFKYKLTDDLDLRLAASQTLTRPDYNALTGMLNLNDLALSGQGGNPKLKPIVSSNFDAALEWYYAPRALLSFGVFYMDLDDYIDFQVVPGEYLNQTETNNQQHDVYSTYLVSQPYNINAKLKGAELAWQQPIGEHFGVAANYTWADGETDQGGPLNGTSDQTWNVSGWFENDRFNARLAYSFRSEYYAGVTRGSNFYSDDVATLSASFGVKISDSLSVSLDALNLTDETAKYYNDLPGADKVPLSFYKNGRQYYLSLRYKFN
ncbi:MAG: TonB-dependent receptor [Pseudoxanthomonas sp.]